MGYTSRIVESGQLGKKNVTIIYFPFESETCMDPYVHT